MQVKAGMGAESAGNARNGKGADSAPGTVSTSTSSRSTGRRASTGGDRAPRGTRLPEDFHATAEMIAWAREHTPNVGAAETDAFIDHFRSAPGQKGVKTDWVATWRNWMRREQKRHDEQIARERRYAERRSEGQGPTASKSIPSGQQCSKHRGQPGGTRDDGGPVCGQCRIEARTRRAA